GHHGRRGGPRGHFRAPSLPLPEVRLAVFAAGYGFPLPRMWLGGARGETGPGIRVNLTGGVVNMATLPGDSMSSLLEPGATRTLVLYKNVLVKNAEAATRNRELFRRHGLFV